MPEPLIIDFETCSPLNLKDVGIYRYTEDPRTVVRCYAAKWGKHSGYFFDMAKPPGWLLDALDDPTVPIHAHNSTVERLIIKRIGRRFGWPQPHPRRFRCSAARARRLALPGALDKLGVALGLGEALSKDKEGKRLMLRMSKPIKHGPNGFIYDDDPIKLERLGQYCNQDVVAEEAAEHEMLDMPKSEINYYHLTERINDRGVKVDVAMVRRLIWRANVATEELNRRIEELTGGAVQKLTNVAQIKQWVYDETGKELKTLRKEDMDGLLNEAADLALPKHVMDVLRIRQEGAKSSVSKLIAILNRVSADGRVHGAFVYHGASTGRYTSMGVQLQNLVRDVLKDIENALLSIDTFTLDQISKCIRACFIPEEGHVYVDADYNAIEARGVAWLAGAKRLLKTYRDNGDPYCDMGAVIYGFAVTKANEWERFVGKQTILGCGYGMGAQKFYDQCVKFGKPVEMRIAETAVEAYRETYPEIPRLWDDMGRAAIRAVQNPGETHEIPNGLVAFRVARGYLQMALPSGRRLFYKRPFLRDRVTPWGTKQKELWFWGINPRTKQWAPEKTWGGTLTENAVQAISRDLLFEAMDKLENLDEIPIVLSVHDQIVAEVLEEDGPWAVKRVARRMTELPAWAAGFPVNAEPKITMRFGK